MADEKHHSGEAVDVQDRGMFDFLGKKKEHDGEGKEGDKCQEEVLVTEFEKVQVAEGGGEAKEEKKEGLLEKLHRSHSSGSSSSSSDEEEAAEGEEKKKKKKGMKEKIKEKMCGDKKEGDEEIHGEKTEVTAAAGGVVMEDNTVPIEKIEALAQPESDVNEKKSLMDKIKEKLPGSGGKKPAEEAAPVAPQCADQGKELHEGDSPKEKKGFLGKIMDKIPGYHKTEDSGAAGN